MPFSICCRSSSEYSRPVKTIAVLSMSDVIRCALCCCISAYNSPAKSDEVSPILEKYARNRRRVVSRSSAGFIVVLRGKFPPETKRHECSGCADIPSWDRRGKRAEERGEWGGTKQRER